MFSETMADFILEAGRAFLAQAAENASDTENVAKPKYEATPAGFLVSYASIMIMSVIPIIFGSFKSVKNQETSQESGEQTETMSTKDAMMFPLIASCALFGLYVVFKIFGTQHVNMLLTAYFFLIGVIALGHVIAPILRSMISEQLVRNEEYHLHMRRAKADDVVFELTLDHFDMIGLAISCALGAWYLVKKHWVANNLFAMAFAHNGIEILQLNSVATGCILLGGLFIYDVFWVFGTDVMVTVARSFEAPIKLVFPQDFLESGFWGKHHAMLGLGDIVIPGIFIALLLRYDMSKGNGSRLYFIVSFIAYVLGLIVTVVVMKKFKHAQPALLYLVPLCVGTPLLVALVMGETKQLFTYRDNPDVEDEAEDKAIDADGETKKKAGSSAGDKNGVATRSKAKKDS